MPLFWTSVLTLGTTILDAVAENNGMVWYKEALRY